MTSSRIVQLVLLTNLIFVLGAADQRQTAQSTTSFYGDEDRVDWAYEQFEAAGLTLVDVELRFAADSEPCDGYLGLHHTIAATHIIDICDPSVNRRKYTLLHELAHVWVAENVGLDTRAEFMELRDVSIWHDGVTPWSKRGTEHAAEILAWGIGDQPCWLRPSLNTGDTNNDFTEGLAILTDAAPRCDAESAKPTPEKRSQVIA